MKIYKIISVLACIALLPGCVPETAEWTAAESPKKNKVDRVVFTYNVAYPAHATEMEVREKKKLQQFLSDSVPSPSAVTATLYEHGGISEKRIKDIKRELLKHGVPNDLIIVTDDQDASDCKHSKKDSHSGVELIIERYLVIPPSCSDFSQKIGDAKQSAPSSNYGCAVEANLGMMVANPRDLIRGRSHDPYNGLVLGEGVARYQTGKITPLINTSTTTPTAQQNSTSTSTTVTPGVS